MTDIFHDGNRQLQDRFDTRRMADRVGELTHGLIAPHDKAFIERMDMFFIATVDENGHANCSYKGGEPGFVRVRRRGYHRVSRTSTATACTCRWATSSRRAR